MAEYPDYEMDDRDDDAGTEGSMIDELVTGVQAACEQLNGCTETAPNGHLLVKEEVVANASRWSLGLEAWWTS